MRDWIYSVMDEKNRRAHVCFTLCDGPDVDTPYVALCLDGVEIPVNQLRRNFDSAEKMMLKLAEKKHE